MKACINKFSYTHYAIMLLSCEYHIICFSRVQCTCIYFSKASFPKDFDKLKVFKFKGRSWRLDWDWWRRSSTTVSCKNKYYYNLNSPSLLSPLLNVRGGTAGAAGFFAMSKKERNYVNRVVLHKIYLFIFSLPSLSSLPTFSPVHVYLLIIRYRGQWLLGSAPSNGSFRTDNTTKTVTTRLRERGTLVAVATRGGLTSLFFLTSSTSLRASAISLSLTPQRLGIFC